MPSILLVGGPLDGQSFDLCQDTLGHRVIHLPELTPLSGAFVTDESVQRDVVVVVRAHDYFVHRITFRNDRSFTPEQTVYMGWHPDLTGPAEAMVMLMQHYENKEKDHDQATQHVRR